MCEALAKGNPDEALKLLRKSVPFPEILCRICDEPCGPACLRGESGEPVRIRMLERAAVEYGREGPSRRPLIRKKQRALVAGGGLAGLTAAKELGRKGYAVTVLVPEDRAGGELLLLPESVLPRDVVQRGVASLPETVTVRTGAAMDLSPRCCFHTANARPFRWTASSRTRRSRLRGREKPAPGRDCTPRSKA
jgi:NADPH-dependent glutamate synthase beta subunit-like oxidoreductase